MVEQGTHNSLVTGSSPVGSNVVTISIINQETVMKDEKEHVEELIDDMLKDLDDTIRSRTEDINFTIDKETGRCKIDGYADSFELHKIARTMERIKTLREWSKRQ